MKQMIALREHVRRHDPKVGPIERPISFNDAMVSALLAGRKTQTRRPMKPPLADREANREVTCPFGAPGERLWVRERWARDQHDEFRYAADASAGDRSQRWRPTFHMPRDACRIRLQIRSIHAERIQSITAADARHEGFDPDLSDLPPRRWFAQLWDSIYNEPTLRWDNNPWVWVIKFRVIR